MRVFAVLLIFNVPRFVRKTHQLLIYYTWINRYACNICGFI